jgi:hypothetical protein
VKAGFEHKGKVLLMVALMLVAAYSLARSFLAPTTPAAAGVSASAKAGTKGATSTKGTADRRGRNRSASWAGKDDTISDLDPTLRFDWLKNSEGREYTGGKRNIFDMEPEPPPRPKVVADTGPKCPGDPSCPPPPPVCPGPDPRCPPPPINLKFYGFASKPGEPKKVFLSSGEDAFVAAEGDVVNRRYRVVKINPGSVEIEDVLNNNKQTIPLSQG